MAIYTPVAGLLLGFAGVVLLAMHEPQLSLLGLALVFGGAVSVLSALYVVERGAPAKFRLWRLR